MFYSRRKSKPARGKINMEYIWMILIGMTAGWLAGQLITGKDFGVTVDIITGMVGALIVRTCF